MAIYLSLGKYKMLLFTHPCFSSFGNSEDPEYQIHTVFQSHSESILVMKLHHWIDKKSEVHIIV